MSDLVSKLKTAIGDRYAIERELGQGGMAVVYLARDLRHERQVALKVLRPELGVEIGHERFVREIKLIASLAHPHILPLFDSGEANGFLYFVMPMIDGESLRHLMNRDGPLSVEMAMQIAREVADALDYAHRSDIVHRDIKPENVMLQGGHAVVADFGIGKAIAGATDPGTLTQTGLLMGTPAYMSPEQASGDASIDGRSDLYSLGCMLYEMLTGKHPFTGSTAAAVIAQRFTPTPPDVTAEELSVPPAIGDTVARLMATAPEDRYDTGAHFIEAVREALANQSVTSQAVSNTPSIAVLPLKSLSTDPDDEFFAEGVTEEIINVLGSIPDLRVAGRSSAFSFKGKNEDLHTIGKQLNVAHVLEGTIRRSGNRLRVTVQLSNAGDGYQLWSERYDRVMEDMFDVQDEIASAIADRLRVSLGAEGRVRPHTKHLAAYELYLKGRALLYQRGLSIPKAVDCFQEAVRLDPDYAQAWAGLADGHTTTAYSGFAAPNDVMQQALEAARRALELDPELAESHNALACATMLYERDFALAEVEFKRAIELNPQYIQAIAWYGMFYLQMVADRQQDAFDVLDQMLQLDPLSSYVNSIMAFSRSLARQPAKALQYARRAVELDPDSYLAGWCLVGTLRESTEYAEAVATAERYLAMSGRHSWVLAELTWTYADWGRAEEARAVYQELEARSARERFQPIMLASAAAAVGELDAAVTYAQMGLEQRDLLLVVMARTWPGLEPIREDPRMQAITQELRYPE